MQGEYEEKKLTKATHDRNELMQFFKSLVIGTVFSYFIHYKWGAVQPLLAQCLMQPFNLITHKLFDIYILGRIHNRPFVKERDMFAEMLKPKKKVSSIENKKNQ